MNITLTQLLAARAEWFRGSKRPDFDNLEEWKAANQAITEIDAKIEAIPRGARPDPRTFDRFPSHDICPICGTNDEGKAVLVPISGTTEERICQAKPIHLACAVAKQWDDSIQVAFTWPDNPQPNPADR